MDAVTTLPVNDVRVIDKGGNLVTNSDSAGYATVLFDLIRSSGILIVIKEGYAPDTIQSPAPVIYLHPLSVMLNTTIVRSGKISRLLHENNEFVVDYAFIENGNILVATYSGNNGDRAKLFLINKDAEVLSKIKLPNEPLSLFKSCVGNFYCVCRNQFYRVSVEGDLVTLGPLYDIKLMAGLQQCEQSFDGNLYYRIGDRANFKVTYGMIESGSNTFKSVAEFEEDDVARASLQEWYEIQGLVTRTEIGSTNMSAAARKQLARLKWDKGSYAHINLPLFLNNDTLIIFDYFQKRILYYNLAGMPKGYSKINFEWRPSQQFEIIKDEVREKFYVHRYNKQSLQTLEELNLNTGTVSGRIVIEKAFAEQVKVYNGDIYCLWQDSHGSEPRQIFIQRQE